MPSAEIARSFSELPLPRGGLHARKEYVWLARPAKSTSDRSNRVTVLVQRTHAHTNEHMHARACDSPRSAVASELPASCATGNAAPACTHDTSLGLLWGHGYKLPLDLSARVSFAKSDRHLSRKGASIGEWCDGRGPAIIICRRGLGTGAAGRRSFMAQFWGG